MTMTAERLAWPAPRSLRVPRPRGAWMELLAVVAIYVCYSAARMLVPGDVGLARNHADDILKVERLLHLDVESAANQWLTSHGWLALAASYWYAALHYTVTP